MDLLGVEEGNRMGLGCSSIVGRTAGQTHRVGVDRHVMRGVL